MGKMTGAHIFTAVLGAENQALATVPSDAILKSSSIWNSSRLFKTVVGLNQDPPKTRMWPKSFMTPAFKALCRVRIGVSRTYISLRETDEFIKIHVS